MKMTDAKLSKLVKFFGNKLDVIGQVDTEFARGQYIAYSIAKRMVEDVVFEILDNQLGKSIGESGESPSDSS